MKQVHKQEKEQFKKIFKDNHLDRFEERYLVLKVFLQTEQHVTARELARLLDERGHRVEPDFVKETLTMMCGLGFAHQNRFEDGRLRYEHRHLGYHHDHMVCTKCKQVVEFNSEEIERLQMHIATTHGFHMLQHRMEIYGICDRCMDSRQQLLPLALGKQGEDLTIQEILGGSTLQMRLVAMGMRVGDVLRVITNNGKGRIVVAVDQKRYVLGREMARKILVQVREH